MNEKLAIFGGKKTFDDSIECLKVRGMMVSFGNASGPLSDINVPKVIQPKGLYLVRPSMQQYLSTREELDEASKTMFEKISSGKVKIKIFKKYKKTSPKTMLLLIAFLLWILEGFGLDIGRVLGGGWRL